MANDNLNCSKLFSQPGIQRDGTPYDTSCFTAGQWTRFYKGRPRKIGGYQAIDYGTINPMRSLLDVPNGPIVDVYIGRSDSITYVQLPQSGATDIAVINEIDRTPDGYVDNPLNTWSLDVYSSTSDTYPTGQIVALSTQNAMDINSQVNGYLYYGSIANSDPLTPVTDTNLSPMNIQGSGGVVYVAPLLIVYGNNGQIIWNDPNAADPLNTWNAGDTDHTALTASISNTKIVKALPVIGAQAPTVLFWSLNQLIRGVYTPTAAGGSNEINYAFTNAPIDKITILAANSVVQYQQTFYWIGTDQFYMYDGVVRTIPNVTNFKWFFDNVNLAQRNKIFGVVIPQYGEIWWSFPFGNSTENNRVLAYNINDKYWFDFELNRSAGLQANLYPFPLMADNQPTVINTRHGPISGCVLWQHETGYNQVINNEILPIPAYYSHHYVDLCSQDGGQNNLLRNRRIEPDFELVGNMTVTITNLMYANDLNNGLSLTQGPFTFNNQTQYIDVDTQGRLTSLTFESNEVNGFFQGGKTLYDWQVGDKQT